MHEITDEQREKFRRFRAVYEAELERLRGEGASGLEVASGSWRAAMAAVPLEPWEEKIYKIMVAMHSVNGGELFGNAAEEPADDETPR